nr:hypothetical protein [Methylobacterium sp. ZNC0032]
MVDLWGPGAFGAADAAAARPAYTPTDGAGDPETFYKDCSSPAEDDGTEWKSAALNMLLVQLRKVVRSTAVAVSNLSDDLLARAIQIGMNYAVAGGSANAWTVSPSLAPLAYVVGLHFDVVAPGTNSSTSVTANVWGLGNKSIKRNDGSDPQVGDLVAGTLYRTVYDGTNIRIQTMLPSQAKTAAFKISRVIFTTPGSFSWTSTVNGRVRIKSWGPAGGGGFGNNPSGPAGGGSGAYFEWTVDVAVGDVISGTIGAGGAAGFAGNNGANGGTTVVTVNGQTRNAGGGAGGVNAGGNTVTNSAAGGTVSGGTVDYSRDGAPSQGGQQGYSGSGTLFYAGKGGDAPNGGYGGNAGTGAGNSGSAPGGGGGGGANGNAAGAGARGELQIEY